jgi:hypothetical protein
MLKYALSSDSDEILVLDAPPLESRGGATETSTT